MAFLRVPGVAKSNPTAQRRSTTRATRSALPRTWIALALVDHMVTSQTKRWRSSAPTSNTPQAVGRRSSATSHQSTWRDAAARARPDRQAAVNPSRRSPTGPCVRHRSSRSCPDEGTAGLVSGTRTRRPRQPSGQAPGSLPMSSPTPPPSIRPSYGQRSSRRLFDRFHELPSRTTRHQR
jgi:hypothetical protein